MTKGENDMASAAPLLDQPKKRARIRRPRQKPTLVVVHGSRTLSPDEADALLRHISAAIQSRSLIGRRYDRIEDKVRPERRSVERAMLVVEEAFVKAMWVLQRTTGDDRPAGFEGNTGISYIAENVDRIGQAVANGGWIMPAPRPAQPSSKEITAAENAHLWVRFLEPLPARVLTVGAMSKRGDAGRRVNWNRVRPRLPELDGYTVRSLQGIYTAALRSIVVKLADEVSGNHG